MIKKLSFVMIPKERERGREGGREGGRKEGRERKKERKNTQNSLDTIEGRKTVVH